MKRKRRKVHPEMYICATINQDFEFPPKLSSHVLAYYWWNVENQIFTAKQYSRFHSVSHSWIWSWIGLGSFSGNLKFRLNAVGISNVMKRRKNTSIFQPLSIPSSIPSYIVNFSDGWVQIAACTPRKKLVYGSSGEFKTAGNTCEITCALNSKHRNWMQRCSLRTVVSIDRSDI